MRLVSVGDDAPVSLPISGLLPSRRAAAAGQLADFIEQEHSDLLSLARTLVITKTLTVERTYHHGI